MNEQRPPLKTDILYGLVSLGSTAVWSIMSGWLLYFYLPPQGEGIARVPAALYGVTIFAVRVVNALLAIPIGAWSDRTRSRWGRRIPFMLASALPMLICFVLLWMPPVYGESVWNMIYLAVILTLYNLMYTLYQIPYTALLPDLAMTDRHRVRMSAWSSSFFLIAMIFGGLGGLLIERLGYVGMALLYAGLALPLFYLPSLILHERRAPPVTDAAVELNFRQMVATMLRNRPFVVMTATTACYWGITTMVQATIPYIVTEICGLSEADTTLFYIPGVLITLICYPLLIRLTARVGKWVVFAGSLLLSALTLPGLLLIGEWFPVSLKIQGIVWIMLQAAAISGVVMLPPAFHAEIVDHDAALTGQRREGIYYATWGVLDQISNGITSAMLPLLLLLGRSRADPHGPLGVRMIGALGGVMVLVGFLIFLSYPLKRRKSTTSAIQENL